MKSIIIFSLITLLYGCAAVEPLQEEASLETLEEEWTGRNLNDLIFTWGAPTNTSDLSDGRKIVKFSGSSLLEGSSYMNQVQLTPSLLQRVSRGLSGFGMGSAGRGQEYIEGLRKQDEQDRNELMNAAISCEIDVFVESDNTVARMGMIGNIVGCNNLIDYLEGR